MPEGNSSYYVKPAERPQDRYEDYIVKDLISDVEARFPADSSRSNRAIIGIFDGRFWCGQLVLQTCGLVCIRRCNESGDRRPSRPFSIKRVGQWREHSSIFGPWGGKTRHDNDPYVLAKLVHPAQMPYLFLSCGEQEGLLPANRRFAGELAKYHFQHEFHAGPGGHDWNQWNRRLPAVFQSLLEHATW